MKHLVTRLLVVAVAGIMLAAAGCVYDETDLVLTETVCVNFDQSITTGTFTTFVVCDQFKQRLLDKLEENGGTLEDIESIHMVNGTFKTLAMSPGDPDWQVTADVLIGRRDDPNAGYTDGPASFVSFEDQSLRALKGSPTDADLHADGVAVVNRALEALRDGEDPTLVLVLENASVTPTPTTGAPLNLKLLTCVKFQVVVDIADEN